MIEWMKLLAWAEIVNVGLILVAIGIAGLRWCFQPGEAPGTLSATLERQLEEILEECQDAREDHRATSP